MDEIRGRRRRQRRDWEAIIEAQSRSGKTAGIYCRENDVPYKLFLYHRRKISGGVQPTKYRRRGREASSSFAPVQVTGAHFVFKLASGVLMESDRLPEPQWLADVVRRLGDGERRSC